MEPKKARRAVVKIEIPTDTPTDFELGDTAADLQREREEIEQREREEEARKQQREKREEAMREETTHSAEEGVAEKCPRTERSDTEMDTESGREAGTSLLQSRHKKGFMTNIYLTHSDKEAIVDSVGIE